MRIDSTTRTQGASYAELGRRAQAGTFTTEPEMAVARAAASPAIAATTEIEGLLALQAMEDALAARRKAFRRSRQIMETLDGLKADLLAGRVSEGRLNLLLALVGQAREHTAPGLDALLDEIELRARVELAKFGRFTAG